MKLLLSLACCLILAWGCSGTGSDTDVMANDVVADQAGPGGCPVPLGSVTFALTNDSPTTRYIKGEWPLDLSQADGMLEPFDHEPVCTGICHVCEPVNCGSCPTAATAILPGETVELEWGGRMYGWPLTSCEGDYGQAECALESCAPAGSYLVEFCQSTQVSEYFDDMGNCGQAGIMSQLEDPACFGILFDFEGDGIIQLSLVAGGP